MHWILGAKLLMSTSFHPQTDGVMERMNCSIGQILRSTVNADQKNWVEKCPMLEFAINLSISNSTGFAPFELNGGYMPSMIRKYRMTPEVPPGVQDFADKALQNLMDAHDLLIKSRTIQKHSPYLKGEQPNSYQSLLGHTQ